MANIGEETEVINSQEATLEVGADTYIAVQDMRLTISRPEDRRPTTDGGVLYFYGKGDNFFEFTLVATTPELDSLNSLTKLDDFGALSSTAFKIVYKDKTGNTKTFAATGVLPNLVIESIVENGVLVRGRVRITGDSVTVT